MLHERSRTSLAGAGEPPYPINHSLKKKRIPLPQKNRDQCGRNKAQRNRHHWERDDWARGGTNLQYESCFSLIRELYLTWVCMGSLDCGFTDSTWLQIGKYLAEVQQQFITALQACKAYYLSKTKYIEKYLPRSWCRRASPKLSWTFRTKKKGNALLI